jgi:hypothetical protein
MPGRRQRKKKSDDDLVFIGLEALEEEMRCWRSVPMGDKAVRLVRCPPIPLDIGPAEVIPEDTATVEMQDLGKDEVWHFLRWRGMNAALKAIRQAEGAA